MPTARGWTVLKFGGTSVATADRWETIAGILRQRLAEGLRPLVVCSALSQVSNRLEAVLERALAGDDPGRELAALAGQHVALARNLGLAALPEPAQRELDRLGERLLGISMTREASPRLRAQVLAAGELLSTRIGAAWLTQQGLAARWLDARELLRADAEADEQRQYLSAQCDHGEDAQLRARLDALRERVLLTQGFIARAPDGATALLGRGGSDTSATLLGARIAAERVEIWTDVPGLFSADPRVVPDARKLARLGYDEASELATRGAKVLHPRSLAPAREAAIPIHVLDTAAPAKPGTVIDAGNGAEDPSALAISSRTGMSVISMDVEGTWQQVGVISELSACFARRGLSIDSIASSQTRVTVSLDPAAHPLDDETMEALQEDLQRFCTPTLIAPVASISVVGRSLCSVLHDLPSLFHVLEAQDVHLISHAADDHSLTFVVDDAHAEGIVRELHSDLVRGREARDSASAA